MSDSLLPNSQNGRPQHHSNMRRRLDDSAAVGRHVHFSDEIQGILVPSLNDMPENEKRSIWYNDEDKGHLKDDLMKDARHMRRCLSASSSTSPESECSTARGIEHLASNATLKQLSDAKAEVIRAVLIEQHRQRSRYGHVTDPLQIAVASSTNSLGAKKTAIAHALIDQEFVLSSCQCRRDDLHVADPLRYKSPQDERAHISQTSMLMDRLATLGDGIQQGREAPMARRSRSNSGIARWSALRQGH